MVSSTRPLRTLVVNADEFGLTPGVSRGIARAHDQGIVTSASLLAGGSGFDEAVRLCRGRPGLGVGLHLDVTDGRPVLPVAEVPTLVDESGRLHGYRRFTLRLLSGRIDREQLRAELAAQLRRLESAGLRPTHLDGRRHAHLLPVLFDMVADLAVEAGIRWTRCPATFAGRIRPVDITSARALGLAGFGRLQYGRLEARGLSSADCFLGALNKASPSALTDAAEKLREVPAGVTEWVVRPGEVDSELMFHDDYVWPRQEELAWLTSAEARRAVGSVSDLRLASYADADAAPAWAVSAS